MREDDLDDVFDSESLDGMDFDATVPIAPMVGYTQYNGELHVRECKDGYELTLDFAAGPIDLTLTEADAQTIVETLKTD